MNPAPRFRALILALTGSIAAQPAFAQTNILFVGNSFTHGNSSPVLNYNSAAITDANGTGYGGIPGIFKKLTQQAGLSYNVTIEAVSSQTLSYHFANKSAIIGQPQWNVVVLQGYSTEPLPTSHGGNPADFAAGAQNLRNLVLTSNPAANVYFYETWAYPDWATSAHGYTGAGSAALQAMQNDLQAGYFKAFYDDGFTGVARSGDGFVRAIDQGVADDNPADGITAGTLNLWASDNKHPSKWGAYLSAAILFARITHSNPTLLGYAGSAASDLGITQADFTRLNRLAFEMNAQADPPPVVVVPPTATLNILKAGTNLNWNSAANWDHALATTDAVLINANSAAISQVATSLDGAGHAGSIQTLSFDIGATTKTVQPNLTTQNPRAMTLTGGAGALGGTDVIHLSTTTTGTASIGANTGFSTLTINLPTSASFNIPNAAATLDLGPSSILSGTASLTKSGAGTLVLSGANTFGGTGKTFTITAGRVFANTPVAGTSSATGTAGVVVNSGATLGGIGQVAPGAGNQVFVSSGGAIAPGVNGIGTLTINGSNTALSVLAMGAGAKFAFELSAGGIDRIALVNGGATGGIAFNGNVIDFIDLSGGTLPAGSYVLFTSTTVGNFHNLSVDANGNVTSGLGVGGGLGAYTAGLQVVGTSLVLNLSAGTVVDANVAFGRPATASTFQAGNAVSSGNDGNSGTRWTASGATFPQWWKVDLGVSRTLSHADIDWFSSASRAYKYKIETSPDDVAYTQVVDRTANTTFGNTSDAFTATARFVRITITGSTAGGAYASAYEFKIFGH